MQETKLNLLIGQTFTHIDAQIDNSVVELENDEYYVTFYHAQDCCESVYLADIVGDISWLLNTPVLDAFKISNADGESKGGEVEEWTYYKLTTKNGTVTLRFYGSSNGYYATDVAIGMTSKSTGKKIMVC